MVTKIIYLDFQDPGVIQYIQVSRYDSGLRAFEFHLMNGSSIYSIPANSSITFRGTKPDRNGFAYDCTYTSTTGVVIVNCTEQMTAVPGDVRCQLVIVDTNYRRLGTFVFILHVINSSTDDGTIYSDSDLSYAEEVLNSLQGIATFDNRVESLENIRVSYIASDTRIHISNKS